MIDFSKSRTARLLAELLIVFLGVLIALGVDAWWAGRTERQRELEYLNALHEDMTVGKANVEAAIHETEGYEEEIDSFLAGLSEGSMIDGTELPFFYGAHAVVPTGTVEALLSTGDINLITDAALRSTIISESATLREVVRQLAMWDEWAMGNFAARFRAEARVAMGEGRSPLERPSVAAARRDAELVGIFKIQQVKYDGELELFNTLRSTVERLLEGATATLDTN